MKKIQIASLFIICLIISDIFLSLFKSTTTIDKNINIESKQLYYHLDLVFCRTQDLSKSVEQMYQASTYTDRTYDEIIKNICNNMLYVGSNLESKMLNQYFNYARKLDLDIIEYRTDKLAYDHFCEEFTKLDDTSKSEYANQHIKEVKLYFVQPDISNIYIELTTTLSKKILDRRQIIVFAPKISRYDDEIFNGILNNDTDIRISSGTMKSAEQTICGKYMNKNQNTLTHIHNIMMHIISDVEPVPILSPIGGIMMAYNGTNSFSNWKDIFVDRGSMKEASLFNYMVNSLSMKENIDNDFIATHKLNAKNKSITPLGKFIIVDKIYQFDLLGAIVKSDNIVSSVLEEVLLSCEHEILNKVEQGTVCRLVNTRNGLYMMEITCGCSDDEIIKHVYAKQNALEISRLSKPIYNLHLSVPSVYANKYKELLINQFNLNADSNIKECLLSNFHHDTYYDLVFHTTKTNTKMYKNPSYTLMRLVNSHYKFE